MRQHIRSSSLGHWWQQRQYTPSSCYGQHALRRIQRRRCDFVSRFSVAPTETEGLPSSQTHSSIHQQSLDTSTPPHVEQYLRHVQDWLQCANVPFSTWTLGLEARHPTLYFILLTSLQQNNTVEASTSSVSLILHLLPTPTSLAECLPARLTQSLTDQTFVATYGANSRSMIYTNHHSNHSNGTSLADLLGSTPIVHLHQDLWSNPHTGPIARARLLCRLGRRDPDPTNHVPSRIYGRHTVARRIQQPTAMAFLERHHLWGATQTKYAFGLYYQPRTTGSNHTNASNHHADSDILVAVATFSSRRNVQRGAHMYRSHELIRFCSQRHGVVVGGISKLLSAFIACCAPDDIVTVIDRDWGVGAMSWHPLGFQTVAAMPPIPMVVRTDVTNATKVHGSMQQRRFHLVGAGVRPESKEHVWEDGQRHDRVGIPVRVGAELALVSSHAEALCCLDRHFLYPIHDAGVERLVLDVSQRQPKHGRQNDTATSMADVWNTSIPTYAAQYYSDNPGIGYLLRHAERAEYN